MIDISSEHASGDTGETEPGPGRLVEVAPQRLAGWISDFGLRHHGIATTSVSAETLSLTTHDGAEAVISIPFPPLEPSGDPVAALAEHAGRDRVVGAVLVRKGGYAIGYFEGPRLVASKVGSSYVQGRTKAGGWSQQRFARRRGNQAAKAYATAADACVRVLLPRAGALDALVGGGDRGGVLAVLEDPRLRRLRPRLAARVLPTPEPRLRVLEGFADQFRAVQIRVNSLA